MEAKELRIGNYVDTPSGSIKIKALDFDALYEDKPKYYIHNYGIEQCKPIPLTEEWLLKFGFVGKENEDDDDIYVKGAFELSEYWFSNHPNGTPYESNGFYFYSDFIDGGELHFKHVHQLQNLYFALTGQELTINSLP